VKKYLITIAIICLFCVNSYSQNDSFFSKVDHYVELFQKWRESKVDTVYVGIPDKVWAVKSIGRVRGSRIRLRDDNSDDWMNLNSATRLVQSFQLGYRNLALGFSFDPKKYGNTAGKSFLFSTYGNRLGLNLQYQDENSYNVKGAYGSGTLESFSGQQGVARNKSINLDAFYALNNKLSMASVFSLSFIQKRSAGSFLLNASAVMEETLINGIPGTDFTYMKTEGISAGVGVGYGYNYVNNGWILHGSVLPSIMFLSHGEINSEMPYITNKLGFGDLIYTGNAAVVKQFGKVYTGLYYTMHYANTGRKGSIIMSKYRYEAMASFAFRF